MLQINDLPIRHGHDHYPGYGQTEQDYRDDCLDHANGGGQPVPIFWRMWCSGSWLRVELWAAPMRRFQGIANCAGYPHFFVLDGQGKLLHSQDTAELEKGKSYRARRFKRFLTRWGPRGSGPSARRGQ